MFGSKPPIRIQGYCRQSQQVGYLRISESFALTWDDIDHENRTLTVNNQIVKRDFGADVRKAVEKTEKRKCAPHGTSPLPKCLSF